jgi:hypothetical protein
MGQTEDMQVSMIETNLSNLELKGKKYAFAVKALEEAGLKTIYVYQTGVLTQSQRALYEHFTAKAEDIAIPLDPILVSFALRDACDLSGLDYVCLDLEGDNEIGFSAWLRRENEEEVLALAVTLLKRHLDKYLLDAYDRRARENMVNIWEAQLSLQECSVCGATSLERDTMILEKSEVRCWKCPDCGRNVVLPSDILEHLREGLAQNSINEEKH